MAFKIKIPKILVLRLAIFVAAIGVASMFDIYFENHPVELSNIQTDSEEAASEHGTIYLINQVNIFSAKTSVQKILARKCFEQSHDKFLQKYHQIRNRQVLKAEAVTQTAPLILSYRYLVFQNYFFSLPDEPLIS